MFFSFIVVIFDKMVQAEAPRTAFLKLWHAIHWPPQIQNALGKQLKVTSGFALWELQRPMELVVGSAQLGSNLWWLPVLLCGPLWHTTHHVLGCDPVCRWVTEVQSWSTTDLHFCLHTWGLLIYFPIRNFTQTVVRIKELRACGPLVHQ